MPTIPTFQSQVRVPQLEVARANPREYGLREVTALGEGITGAALDLKDTVTRARRVTELGKLEVQATQGLSDLELKSYQDPDYQNAPKNFATGAGALRKSLLESTQDPVVQQELSHSFDMMSIAKSVDVRSAAFKREVDANQAQLNDDMDVYANQLANTKNEVESKQLMTMATNRILGAAAAGWISQEEAGKKGRALISRVQEVKFRQTLIGDPEAALKNIIDPKNYQGMDELKRVELTQMAQNKVDSDRTQRNAEYDRAERRAEKLLHQQQAENEVHLMQQVDQNPDSIQLQTLDQMVTSQAISPEGYRMVRSAKYEDLSGRDNNHVVLDLMDRIGKGEDVRVPIAEALAEQQLSGSTMRQLMNDNAAQMKGDRLTADQKDAEKYLKGLLNVDNPFSLTDPKAATAARALRMYHQELKKGDDPYILADKVYASFNDRPTDPQSLPIPQFFDHRPNNINEVRDDLKVLVEKWDAGSIDEDTYNRELENYKQWKAYYEGVGDKSQPSNTDTGPAAKVKP